MIDMMKPAMTSLALMTALIMSGSPRDSRALAGEGVTFTRKPTAKKAGAKVKIEFAVDKKTDVAVYILDAKGKIVRHLVAGMLGKNPPSPLKPNAISQSIEWDGRGDDALAARGGPFKVRVAAGMKPRHAGTVFSKNNGPNNIANVAGLTVGPDGRLFVLASRWWRPHWQGTAVHVFQRNGSYEKTIKPFPAHLPAERVKALSAFKTREGEMVPLIHRVQGTAHHPAPCADDAACSVTGPVRDMYAARTLSTLLSPGEPFGAASPG